MFHLSLNFRRRLGEGGGGGGGKKVTVQASESEHTVIINTRLKERKRYKP